MRTKIKVYIIDETDGIYSGMTMAGNLVYPTKKRMYTEYDNVYVYLRDGQNRKKLIKKVILDLVRYSSYLPNISGEILNSYEVT